MLNKERMLKNKTYPLVFRIIYKRRKKLYYTPYKLFEEEFDEEKEGVRYLEKNQVRSRNEVKKINRYIHAKRKEIDTLTEKMSLEKPEFTVADLLHRLKLQSDEQVLITYIDKLISLKKARGNDGIAAAYLSTQRSIIQFIGSDSVTLSEINGKFVYEYQQYLLLKGISVNTISYYMRNFRSIYNQALMGGYNVNKENPFAYIKIRSPKTLKRAISRNNIRTISVLELKEKPVLDLARDIFMFSFHARGMSFVDIVNLKKSNISEDIIYYSRNKTHQWLQVTLTKPLKALIRKYKNDSEYIFPIIKTSSVQSVYNQYKQALIKINSNLKQIGKMADVSIPLTTYVARHTWATLAKEIGVPISMISEGLGHTSEKTTQIYLREFDRNRLDHVFAKVTALAN